MSDTINGTLRVHPLNARYFTDDSGSAIYLTGSHTWANLQEVGLEGDPLFPYDEFLGFMSDLGHNFMRLWIWEQPERASWTDEVVRFDPLPWNRTGPGVAADGKPKFDLDSWNDEFFVRLRDRCVAAGERGIYVGVMLFQGWSLEKRENEATDPFPFHPFNGANNINGVDVAYGGNDDDEKPSLHSMMNPTVIDKQEAWIRKVIDTVNDLDHVLYEVINEGGATAWQYHVTNFVHEYEKTKPKQHPMGMTTRAGPPQLNSTLFNGPADWVSPVSEPRDADVPGSQPLQDYANDPPVADGSKVVLLDTDHIWGFGANAPWVWKSFVRGHNPIFMDPWRPLHAKLDITPGASIGGISMDRPDYPDWDPVRRAMGDTLRYARRMDLAAMTPRPDLASTRYCLANPGEEYLIYLPDGGTVTIDLGNDTGPFNAEWFIPQIGRSHPGVTINEHLGYAVATAPFTGDAVLYLYKDADTR